MEQAQAALQVTINNAQDEANALNRQDLIEAIGRGTGNNAAHEIAHQFLGLCCSMDALTSDDPMSAATYNNGDADGSPNPQIINSDPAPYTGFGKDGKTAIHWENTTQQALNKCLSGGWKDYGLTLCAVKLNLSLTMPISGSQQNIWAKALVRRTHGGPVAQKPPIIPFLQDLAF